MCALLDVYIYQFKDPISTFFQPGTSSNPPPFPSILLVFDSSLVELAFDRELNTPIEFLVVLKSPDPVD